MGQDLFILHSNYTPSGDQTEAIAKLIAGINNGVSHQTLKRGHRFWKNFYYGKCHTSFKTANLNLGT